MRQSLGSRCPRSFGSRTISRSRGCAALPARSPRDSVPRARPPLRQGVEPAFMSTVRALRGSWHRGQPPLTSLRVAVLAQTLDPAVAMGYAKGDTSTKMGVSRLRLAPLFRRLPERPTCRSLAWADCLRVPARDGQPWRRRAISIAMYAPLQRNPRARATCTVDHSVAHARRRRLRRPA